MNSPMHRHLGLTVLVAILASSAGCNKSKPTDSGGAPPVAGPAGTGAPVGPGGPVAPAGPKGGPAGYTGSKMGPPGGLLGAAGNDTTVVQATGEVTPLVPTSDSKSRQQSLNNLRQIGLAWHNFSDVNTKVPLGVYDASGKKIGLSWRVSILPYIGQADLYKQFKLDEPWDSPTNKALIPQMPKVYSPQVGAVKAGFTYYRAFTGPETVSPPAQGGGPGKEALGLGFLKITDGTSNTGIVAEAGDPVEWTKPHELEYVAGKPLPRLGGIFGDGFHVILADGSVRWFPTTTPPATIKGVITANGGELVKLP